MKIGIISLLMDDKQRTGIATYVYSFIQNLIKIGKAKSLYLIHCKRCQDGVYIKTNDIIIPKMPFKLTSVLGLPYVIGKINVNILHIPAHWYTQIMPFFLNSKVKKIITIHDLLPLFFPETVPYTKETIFLWNSTLKLIKSKIDMIIAVSQNTKNDCIKYLNIPEEKIKVITLASDEIYKPINNKQEMKEEIYKKYRINSSFILYVGTVEKRKNVSVLIKAFYKLKTMKITHKLIIIGKKGWKYNDIFKTIEILNLQKDVILTGYVPKEDLFKFYNLADVFVYPSLYEGFGLPPLEAMACGCPVITSNTSSLPEVVGDAGMMVNPYDVEGLAKAIFEVITDESLRKELSKKSLERAKLFSWRKTAEKTWKVYEEVYYGK